MNHLPQALVKSYSLPKIELLCAEDAYDNKGFYEFPLRYGWQMFPDTYKGHYCRQDGSEGSSRDAAALCQAWLIFGLMTEVLVISNVHFEPRDFVETVGDTRLVDTSSLTRYIKLWEESEMAFSPEEHSRHFHSVRKLLTDAATYAFDVGSLLLKIFDEKEALNNRLALEIMILGETLEHASTVIWSKNNNMSLDEDLHVGFESIRAWSKIKHDLPRQLGMRGKAWCKSERVMILSDFDTTTTYFASTLQRYANDGLDHSACSTKRCFARQVDNSLTATYKTQHTTKDCLCTHVKVNRDLVISILAKGRIPRIAIQEAGSGLGTTVELKVVDSGPYVAISHVWSDGLGNPKENSLPTCQLGRLRDMVGSLYFSSHPETPVLLWIDTLCVPLEDHSRKIALRLMAKTYKAADRVLVLDSELQRNTMRCSMEEILIRVCLCGWMRRLWTLQEGVFGREGLRFQFLEGPIEIPRSYNSVSNSIGLNAISFLNRYLPFSLSRDLLGSKPNSADLEERYYLARLLMALQYRTTSKAEDETLCFGTLLHEDIAPLTSIRGLDQRAERFLFMLMKRGIRMPPHFLFTDEPKLQTRGFRWAPASFSAIETVDAHILVDSLQKEGANFDGQGLYYNFDGYEISFGSEPLKNIIWFWAEKDPGQEYRCDDVEKALCYAEPTQPGGYVYPRQKDQPLWGAEWEKARHESLARPALVMSADYPFCQLVNIYKEERVPNSNRLILFATPLAHCAKVEAMPNLSHPDLLPRYFNPVSDNLVTAVRVGPDQMWCIG